MIKNLETESLAFGEDAEFHRRLAAFIRHCLEWIQTIPWLILSIFYDCWSFLKYVVKSIANLILRRCIAIIVFVLSVIIPVYVVVLRENRILVILVYCISSLSCSILSLIAKKGSIRFVLKNRYGRLETQKLLEGFDGLNEQVAHLPAGYGAQDRRLPLQRALENLKEPRPETEAGTTFDSQRSSSFLSLKCCDESSTGPYHAPNCPNSFKITINEDSYDAGESSQGPHVARLAADAIEAFGPPLQVFGADSYIITYSSDENLFSDESLNSKPTHFAYKVEVHHPDSHIPLDSRSVGSRSADSALVADDESATKVGSDSLSNLHFIDDDDQSSESSCSNSQNSNDEKSS